MSHRIRSGAQFNATSKNMQLYKYCKKIHMDAMLKNGSARIGSLFDWRQQGKYGEMTQDESEGITKSSGNIIFYDYKNIAALEIESTVRVEGEGANQVRHFTNDRMLSPNVYTFSTSSSYSQDEHQKWFEEEGYDACYRINSARLFFRTLSEKLVSAEFIGFGPVHYVDATATNQIFDGLFHPALLKRKEVFEMQSEVRALWRHKDSNSKIEPLQIVGSRAGIYCEVFRFI